MPDLLDKLSERQDIERQHESVFPVAPRRSLSHLRTGYTKQLLRVGIPIWLSDVTATSIALFASYLVTLGLGKQINHFVPFAFCCILAQSLSFWASGLYPGVGLHPARELRQLFRGVLVAALVLTVGLLLVSNWASPYVWMVAIGFPTLMCLLVPIRSVTKALMRRFDLSVPFYFLGRREDLVRVFDEMSRFGWTMLRPIGRFSPPESQIEPRNSQSLQVDSALELKFERQVEYIGGVDELEAAAVKNGVCWLFVVGQDNSDGIQVGPAVDRLFPEVIWLRKRGEPDASGTSILNCGLASGVRVEDALLLPGARLQKRMLDIFLTGTVLVLLSPLVLLLCCLVKATSRGPVFFSHKRIGRGGQSFKAWKFRSMVSNAEAVLEDYLANHPELREEWVRDHKLKYDPRITTVGRLLRKTSLDELPQLWNVLTGEMSLVGPRPIVDAEVEKYGDTFEQYLRVVPGITGLWQISGRNNTTYAERLAFDDFYVKHWTPWFDLYILLRTVKTVLFCEGAY